MFSQNCVLTQFHQAGAKQRLILHWPLEENKGIMQQTQGKLSQSARAILLPRLTLLVANGKPGPLVANDIGRELRWTTSISMLYS